MDDLTRQELTAQRDRLAQLLRRYVDATNFIEARHLHDFEGITYYCTACGGHGDPVVHNNWCMYWEAIHALKEVPSGGLNVPPHLQSK